LSPIALRQRSVSGTRSAKQAWGTPDQSPDGAGAGALVLKRVQTVLGRTGRLLAALVVEVAVVVVLVVIVVMWTADLARGEESAARPHQDQRQRSENIMHSRRAALSDSAAPASTLPSRSGRCTPHSFALRARSAPRSRRSRAAHACIYLIIGHGISFASREGRFRNFECALLFCSPMKSSATQIFILAPSPPMV